MGLECGADDYITKPFDVREVVARIRATLPPHRRSLRRTAEAADSGEVHRYRQWHPYRHP
jgi:DNA-binding response OmpR family regulator